MNVPKWNLALAAWLACSHTIGINSASGQEQPKISFKEQVAPVLLEHCVSCHSAKRAEGGYRVDTVTFFLQAGDSGEEPVFSEDKTQGEVLKRVLEGDESVRMPADSEPLHGDELEVIQKWYAEGAVVDTEEVNAPLWQVIPPKNYPAPPASYPQPQPVTALMFHSNGGTLLSSGYHEVIEWKTEDGALAHRFPNQVKRILALQAVDGDGTLVVGGGSPGELGEVRVSWVENGELQKVFSRAPEIVLDFAFRPNSNDVAVALADSTIRIVDRTTGETKKVLSSHADWVTQLAFNEDGSKLGSSSKDKSAKVYDMNTGEILVSYAAHGATVCGIAAIGNGDEWMTVGEDARWHRWKLDKGERTALIALGAEPGKLAKIDSFAITFANDMHWYQIDLAENKLVRKVLSSGGLTSVACDPQHKRIATGGLDGQITLWNLNDGSKIREWRGVP